MRRAWVALLLLAGFGVRAVDIGSAPLQGDEAWTAFLAFDFGHNGNRAELGLVSSAGVNQPPFFHDVFFLPFVLSPDPRIARLFMAVLQLVGLALLYRVVKRFWNAQTALAALILFATMPRAIWASRALWNPYLMLPFMAGYFLTTFLALEGRRWARWLHPPLLACAISSHPIGVFYGLYTLLIFVLDWRRTPASKRRALGADYFIGGLLAALVILPWAIGYLSQRLNAPAGAPLMVPRARSAFEDIFAWFILNPNTLDFGAYGIPSQAYTPLPDAAYYAIGWFVFLASVFLITRDALRNRLIGAAYLLLPIALFLLPRRTYNQYFIPILPVAAVVLAVVLVGGSKRRQRWGWGIIGIICVLQLALVIDAYRQVNRFDAYTVDSMLSLDDMVALRDAAVREGYETIYLVEGTDANTFEQAQVWQMLATEGPSRVIWGDTTTLPVPSAGATYVGYAHARHIPELYARPAPRLLVYGLYRVVDLPPNSGFTPTCAPEGPAHLANGAHILGYHTPGARFPKAGEPWEIYVLWKGAAQAGDMQHYQMFNHLVDAESNRYGQQDLPTLPVTLWRAGDTYITSVHIVPGENLPAGARLFLRTGMYTLPDVRGVPLAGTAGQWVTTPVCQGP